jgi:L-ascorbate metabolism protein UlaG (beta-lactamase superfamily)
MIRLAFITGLLVGGLSLGAMAQQSESDTQERRPSHCIALAENTQGIAHLHKANFRAPVPDSSVRIQFVAHASFLIQTPGGLSAVTDFTGFLGNVDFIPDVVTMNHAHSTHWTPHPDPAIPHVLRGWGEEFGTGIDHYLDLGEMLVRNVSTDIRPTSFGGAMEPEGNSIFVFEVGRMCIAHLGHLHHEPSPEQYAALGRVDVVMAPVDGGLTLDLPTMQRVLGRLKSSVVIPMHWWGDLSLRTFLNDMGEAFDVVETDQSAITLSLDTLPSRPTVMVLKPQWLREPVLD